MKPEHDDEGAFIETLREAWKPPPLEPLRFERGLRARLARERGRAGARWVGGLALAGAAAALLLTLRVPEIALPAGPDAALAPALAPAVDWLAAALGPEPALTEAVDDEDASDPLYALSVELASADAAWDDVLPDDYWALDALLDPAL